MMKSLSLFLFFLGVLSQRVQGTARSTTLRRSLQGSDYKPWEIGTGVYKVFDDGAYEGKITYYQNGVYIVKWSDGDVESYGWKEIDQMVKDDEPWAVGTGVYKKFPDGWYEGKIISYSHGKYEVQWSDGDVATYSNSEIDPLVKDYEDLPDSDENSSSPVFSFGTIVYKKFDGVDFRGTVTGFEDGLYLITWSDKEVDKYTAEETQKMVKAAASHFGHKHDEPLFADGTIVYEKSESGSRHGTITNHHKSVYTVTWSNGDKEHYSAEDVSELVHNAAERYGHHTSELQTSRRAGMTAFLVVCSVMAALVAIVYAAAKQRQSAEEITVDLEISVDDEVQPPEIL